MILDAAKTAIAPYLLYLKLAAILAIIAALLWYRHSLIAQGDAEGYQRGHAELVEYEARVTTEANRRLVENAAKDAEVRKTNEAALNDYQAKYDSANARSNDLAKRLYAYTHKTTSSTGMPQADNRPSVIEASGKPGGEEVTERFRAYDLSCIRDSARLDALIAEIKGQMQSD